MTPDAVIHRYLELIAQPSVDVTQLCDLIGADADLLVRWLRLLDCPANLKFLNQRIRALSDVEFTSLAQAQAWFVLPIVGSARLSLDQWQTVLKAACLAEILYLATDRDAEDSDDVRMRALLALSGVNLESDPELTAMNEYRGINPVLLEDASPELKAFAVADGLETGREAELAQQLLRMDADAFHDCFVRAQSQVDEIAARAQIDLTDDSDWAQRIWLRQQVSIACACFAEAKTPAEFLAAHKAVSRSLFSSTPEILLLENERLVTCIHPGLVVNRTSVTSRIAQSLRVGQTMPIVDAQDLAVVDRQILRSIDAEEGLAIPICVDRPLGVMIVKSDEDIDVEFTAELYVEELAKWLVKDGSGPEEELRSSDIERFRNAEIQRLREIIHEANNPLSIVHNYLHILELRLQTDPELAEQIDLIAQELRRAGDVFASARDVPEQVLQSLAADEEDSDEFDLVETVRRISELHRGYAQERSVNIENHLDDEPIRIHSNEAKLIQVLANLVKNGIEACHAGDTVTLRTQANIYRDGRPSVEIVVGDTGPGIDGDVLAVLFEPKESQKGGDHQGLGLHLAYRLIGELCGSLDVRTSPADGTAFHVYLPSG